ncbi:phage minor head protein [Sphingomonas xinjiangensis]|uniref:Phage head morphogenesis domain-containing protein n=1 Tax=Sphingomonas xinjiangensis TaxID=643568 RepID=A0A840YK66_9SPHN|nr:phage minor head protein [Sphingomonas xinjiangensis]MBB5709330.1 hypothetical protein [Sphingomonas xinjiangensis]
MGQRASPDWLARVSGAAAAEALMRYDLATLARRARNPRRKAIVIRDIVPPAVLSTDLYRAAYLPVVTAWERHAAGIAEEYARTLSGMTTDSAEDLQARLDAASSELERLFILLDSALRDWTVRTEAWQRDKWRGAVLSATGVDLGTMLGPEDVRETLASYLAWNSDLVRDVSAQTRKRISHAVFSGLQNRTPAREVAKSIREATGLARDRSQRIASDQLSKVSSALADERRRQAGISYWKWRHSGKLHPRVRHQDRDGDIYADTAAGAGGEVDGKTVLAPPEANDLPGRQPYCGCRSQSVLVLDD